MPKTIALVTDLGLKDNYVGILKGVMLKINPSLQFVDITHDIPAQDIFKAAFTLKAAYSYFPSETIFLAVVDPGVGTARKPLIIKTKNYTFVGPDNGIFSLLVQEEGLCAIFAITNERYFLKPVSKTFHGRDVFAPVAGYLSRGVPPQQFGPRIKKIILLDFPMAKVDLKKKFIIGEVIDKDNFGNAITNIRESQLGELKGGGAVKIKNKLISHISSSYMNARKGSLLAIVGSKGLLEISVNQGSAMQKLKIRMGERVEVF